MSWYCPLVTAHYSHPECYNPPKKRRSSISKVAKSQTANLVVLVGFMGAGKTSVGNALAALLTCQFLDLDEYIQARTGRTIGDIFCQDGEAAFRRIESRALKEVADSQMRSRGTPLVLAVGGGAFVQFDNVHLLRSAAASVVFLDASAQVLMDRCRRQGSDRPLFRDENQFRQLYEHRRSAYIMADVCINTERKTIAQVASEVAASLSLKPGGTVVHEGSHEK